MLAHGLHRPDRGCLRCHALALAEAAVTHDGLVSSMGHQPGGDDGRASVGRRLRAVHATVYGGQVSPYYTKGWTA